MRNGFVGLLVVAVVAGCSGRAEFHPSDTSPADMHFSQLPDAEVRQEGVALKAEGATREEIETATTDTAPADRKIVYEATVEISVANRDSARSELERIVDRHKGFVQHSTLEQVTFRVPPEEFETTLKEIESLGKVLRRELSTEDVTARYVDLQLRMDVAETSRQRLLALLEKADKTEDLLEIERELRRLTEEIETMKGHMRVLQDRIDLATITVVLREVAPARPPRTPYENAKNPFSWIEDTGIDRTMAPLPTGAPLHGEISLFRLLGWPHFKMDVPQGFVKLLHTYNRADLTTAKGDRVRVRLVHPRQKTPIEFWVKALAEDLTETRGYPMGPPEEFEMGDPDLVGRVLHGTCGFAGANWRYTVWVVQEADDLNDMLIVEFARPENRPDESLEEVSKAVRSAWVRW